jgi:hypothetical protein
MILGLVVLLVLAGPLLWALYGLREPSTAAAARLSAPVGQHGPRVLPSMLLYALAFNVTFFIQELFLVLPKALTPGLHPRLFHNNHTWSGDNPLAALWQGTGALAILLSGSACLSLLRRHLRGSPEVRLWLIWMAYCGFFMALPQVVVGALSPASDVGMAMHYLKLSAGVRSGAALVALLVMPWVGWQLCGEFLRLGEGAELDDRLRRMAFVLKIATLPALLALPVIVLFRVPREAVEVIGVPLVVSVVGTLWIQASAWRLCPEPRAPAAQLPLRGALTLLCALLLIFQLLLRPGVG